MGAVVAPSFGRPHHNCSCSFSYYIRHNLALAYANNKLQIALQRGERPQGLDLNDPAQAACVLASWYSDCLEQLINLEDSKIYSPSSMD